MKALILGALLTCVPSALLAQEAVPRATVLPPDVRFEVITWSSLGPLRLDKSTGEVAVLVDFPKYQPSWEPSEFKADHEGSTAAGGPRYRPTTGGSARFQIVAGAYHWAPYLVNTSTGETWKSLRVKRIRDDGLEYNAIEWRPILEKGRGGGGS